MIDNVKDREYVEKVLGSPLPEIDPIYYEGAKIWAKVDVHPFITPYFLSRLYTVEEMKMVLCLPATCKEVADKLGLDEEYVTEKLAHLFEYGRILPGKAYHKETTDRYTPTMNTVTLRDQIGMAYNKLGLDWNNEKELFWLADRWCFPSDYTEEEKKNFPKSSRVIPKWNSIKNVPGVMPLENMKEIMIESFNNGTFAKQRCVCKAYKNFERYGQANFEDGSGCASGLKENGPDNGHCFTFGQRGRYVAEMFGQKVETMEELEQILAEAEDAKVVYMAKNMPEVGNVCTCCEDCCGLIHDTYKIGADGWMPSRFRPVVRTDKCVGCGMCAKRCVFDAVSYEENGKCVIDPDKCKGCGNCVIKCPTGALHMKLVHGRDWIPDIEDYVK